MEKIKKGVRLDHKTESVIRLLFPAVREDLPYRAVVLSGRRTESAEIMDTHEVSGDLIQFIQR